MHDLISSFHICQLVTTTTHKAGECLDLIITRSGTVISDVNAHETGISYRLLVTGHMHVALPRLDSVSAEGRR